MQRMMLESLPAYTGFASGGSLAYNQAAFRHFLAIERRRAEGSTRAVLLILVDVRPPARAGAKLTTANAAAIFRGLGESVREVDFVGWFREGRVAGAVLPEGTVTATETARQLMAARVRQALTACLPSGQSKNLRVRIIRLASRGAANRRNAPSARALSGY